MRGEPARCSFEGSVVGAPEPDFLLQKCSRGKFDVRRRAALPNDGALSFDVVKRPLERGSSSYRVDDGGVGLRFRSVFRCEAREIQIKFRLKSELGQLGDSTAAEHSDLAFGRLKCCYRG